jgi:hypothetical protein
MSDDNMSSVSWICGLAALTLTESSPPLIQIDTSESYYLNLPGLTWVSAIDCRKMLKILVGTVDNRENMIAVVSDVLLQRFLGE